MFLEFEFILTELLEQSQVCRAPCATHFGSSDKFSVGLRARQLLHLDFVVLKPFCHIFWEESFIVHFNVSFQASLIFF